MQKQTYNKFILLNTKIMKKKILKFGAYLLVTFCTNISVVNAQQTIIEIPKKEDKEIVTTLKKEDILKWLKAQITPSTQVRNKFIADILDNVMLDDMYLQRKGPDNNSRIIIVPLKNVYFSQHISKTGQKPFQNLIVSILPENNVDKIFTINLSIIDLKDKPVKKLPKNTFNNFFQQTEPLDGTYALVSIFLGDVKYTEMEIKNGERVQHKSWRYKKMNNAPDSSSRMWYLETTDIIKEADGKLSLKTKTEDLGVSNTVSPPKFKGDLRNKEYEQ